jgi:hypothetical protein
MGRTGPLARILNTASDTEHVSSTGGKLGCYVSDFGSVNLCRRIGRAAADPSGAYSAAFLLSVRHAQSRALFRK